MVVQNFAFLTIFSGKDWLLLLANRMWLFETYVFYLVNGWQIRDAFISTNESAQFFTDNQSETTIKWRHIRAVGGEFVVLIMVQFP